MKKKWLEELKVGDSVCVEDSVFNGEKYYIEKVEKITPKGFIKVGGILYCKDGFERSSDMWYKKRLLNLKEKGTQILLKNYRDSKEIEDVKRDVKDCPLTIEQVREIKDLLHKWGFV